MEIYVVQPGDTIESVAQKFNISVEKLLMDNGIMNTDTLVVGQTLVMVYPLQVYTVKEGDTLASIAETFQVPVMQLLRNNPFLAERQYIYPGEILTVSYDNSNGDLVAVGYTFPFIMEGNLRKTLPNLAYLPIFNYRVTLTGELVGSDEDVRVIQTAHMYETVPTMVVSAFSETGEVNIEVVYETLLNQQAQDNLIESILNILQEKDYDAVNLAFQFINSTNQQLFLNYLTKVADRLHPRGYSVFLTLNPGLSVNGSEVIFQKINYADFGKVCDGILLLSYDWGFIDRPPVQFSIVTTPSFLDYIVAQVPLNKIRIGIPTLGYDWQLPYVAGVTRANVLNFDSVLTLARETNAVINYDEKTLSSYFEYVDINGNQHIVWFKDARSIDSSIKILLSYGINGIGFWNIMYYFTQLWLVINSQYQIVKV